jgi:PIN like domain
VKLLLNQDFSSQLARALGNIFIDYHDIVSLREKFSSHVADIEWMAALDREGGWSVLIKDPGIVRRLHQKISLDRYHVVFFTLGGAWKKYNHRQTMTRLIDLVPKMAVKTKRASHGIFQLPVSATSRFRQQSK